MLTRSFTDRRFVFSPADAEGAGGVSDGEGEAGTAAAGDTSGEGNASDDAQGSSGGGTVLAKAADEGGASTDGAGEEAGDAGEKTDETDPRDAVPEDGKYAFTFDEGQFELSKEAQEAYSKAFAETGLTQRQADTLVKAHTDQLTSMAEAADTQWKEQVDNWAAEARADKELGADWSATQATAGRAMRQFGSEDFVKMLDETGMGNHPEVIRAFSKIGKAMSEDRFVTGEQDTSPTPAHERWYGGTTPSTKRS